MTQIVARESRSISFNLEIWSSVTCLRGSESHDLNEFTNPSRFSGSVRVCRERDRRRIDENSVVDVDRPKRTGKTSCGPMYSSRDGKEGVVVDTSPSRARSLSCAEVK
jgi:hypothetical protein